jgi:hypothetical protein
MLTEEQKKIASQVKGQRALSFEPATETEKINSIVTSALSGVTTTPQEQPQETGNNPLVDFVIGGAQGAGQTLQNIGGMVTKPLAALTGIKDVTGLPEESFQPKNTEQKAGKIVERVAEFILPAGKVAKATSGLSFLPKIAARTGADVAITAVQDGNFNNAGQTGAISAATQALSPGLRFLSSIAGNTLKRSAGTISGVGSDVIDEVLKKPNVALQTMKIPALKSLKEDSANLLKQTKNLSKQSTTNYGDSLADLPKALGRPVDVVSAGKKTTIKVDGKKYTLSTIGIKQDVTETLRKYGAEVNPRKGTIDFMGTTLDKDETKRLQEVFNLVKNWKDTTPKGINTLATKIKAYKKPGVQSKQLNSMIGQMSSSARNYISKRVPALKEMNDRFIKEQRFLDEIQAQFGVRDGFDTAQNVKKVASRLQTLFTKNKDMAREVLDALEGNISARQAGREFATDVPLSGARIGDTVSGLLKSIIPPETVGTIVAKTGIAIEKLQPVIDSLNGLDTVARAAIINLIKED